MSAPIDSPMDLTASENSWREIVLHVMRYSIQMGSGAQQHPIKPDGDMLIHFLLQVRLLEISVPSWKAGRPFDMHASTHR